MDLESGQTKADDENVRKSTAIILTLGVFAALSSGAATIAFFDPSPLNDQARRAAERGNFERAARLQTRYIDLVGPSPRQLYELGRYHARAGHAADAAACFRAAAVALEKRLTDPDSAGRSNEHGWYNLACYWSLVGDKELALDALETAVRRGWANPTLAEEDDDFLSIRDDPRFAAAIADMRQRIEESKRKNELHRMNRPVDTGGP
jgi:tetratricopeptide (TPR) repeat protein